MKKKTILYFCPNITTFIQRDIDLLSTDYQVKAFSLKQGNPVLLIPMLAMQFLFLVRNLWNCKLFICHFAGYSSLLPVIFGKLFHKPCLIIVGGTDAAKFPEFSYGSYVKKFNGMATAFSLRHCTHILPVHESLVYQDYAYDEAGAPAQGYTLFASGTGQIPFTPVYYGYDADLFKPTEGVKRKPLTFITVGNLKHKSLFIRKGYDLVIELARNRPELSFSLVGWDGTTQIDVPDNVQLLPYMNQQEIIQAFSGHEFYFQLSVMEGFPNALCEAMLCGCIPIGSDVSGIPFIIGNTGYVLRQRKVDLLNTLITQIKENVEREKLSAAARNRIRQNFTLERRRKELTCLIELYTKQE